MSKNQKEQLVFDKLYCQLQVSLPGLKIKPKKDSKLHAIIGKLMPWMDYTKFSTTLGNTIYLSEHDYGNPYVLFHEGRHVWNHQKRSLLGKILHPFLYLIPQSIAFLFLPFMLLNASIFNVLVFFFWLFPLMPAFRRSMEEISGYESQVKMIVWLRGDIGEIELERIKRYVDGSDYFYTSGILFKQLAKESIGKVFDLTRDIALLQNKIGDAILYDYDSKYDKLGFDVVTEAEEWARNAS